MQHFLDYLNSLTPYQAMIVVVLIALLVAAIPFFIGKLRESSSAAQPQAMSDAEQQATEQAKANYIASLPRLNTSHMLAVPMTSDEIEKNKKYAGTFGYSNAHMLVTDRDGKQYLCFMTPYNHQVLWFSLFYQASYTPSLIESANDFEVDGVRFGAYPTTLWGYHLNEPIWQRWARLRREFDGYKSDYHLSFLKYFDHGRPRETPARVSAA